MYGVLKDSLGHTYRLRARFTIGRASDNDLTLGDAHVSRHHAVITGEGGRWWLHDLGSGNGVRVNGRRLTGKCALQDGDRVQLGDTTLRFAASAKGAGPSPDGDTVRFVRPDPLRLMRGRFRLTPREAEVLWWIAEGKSNPEIGVILRIKLSTVRKHTEHILPKLGVENRRCAMRMVWELLGVAAEEPVEFQLAA